MYRNNSSSRVTILIVAVILLLPFAILGVLSLQHSPVDPASHSLQGVSVASNLAVSKGQFGPRPSAPPSAAKPSTPCPRASPCPEASPCPRVHEATKRSATKELLFAEEEFWTKEITGLEKVELSDLRLEALEVYSLYKTPTDDWVKRGKEKLKPLMPGLSDALRYVDDPEQRITVTTVLFDLGRDKLKGFTRGFDEYIRRFQRVIDIGFPMIIFMESDKVSSFNFERNKKVTIIPFTVQDLVARYPNYFERIEEIRHSPLYIKQAQYTGWLAQSPQASLKYYNLMVMTKIFLLRYGARLNPFHTQYHMFLDAGHLCGGIFNVNSVNLLRQHMGRMMVTYFDYGAGLQGESHGMAQRAYRYYVGPPFDDPATMDKEWCCRIVRGGIFGGTPAYIDAVAEAYNEILAQSLADGYMGTEENILGATYYRFPELFNAFKNEGGDNCAIFSASKQKGKDTNVYVHADTPDDWHSK